jgi:predicted TIM-barrel fold metal-dependent hydrolase
MVDPWRGRAGARDAERLIEAGARGFKFHPPAQGFWPNDRRFYLLYEVLNAHRMPALFHTGQTAVGQGAPGGGGIRLAYGNPMPLDDVAVDFPDMPIILAHPSFPWQDEAISVALHKPTVYIDLSGWSPKYFPPQLVQYSNTLLKEKVMFGSDHPMITADRWLADFEKAGFREEVKPLLLKENAARLLGLRPEPGPGPAAVDPPPALTGHLPQQVGEG